MQAGAITANIDVAQVVLYAFWIFFAGLILYLRREDKREGYPLESDRSAHITVQGFPAIPRPKIFRLRQGGTASAPNFRADTRDIKARPIAAFPGAPLEPTGDPMADGVGPASYAERADVPDITIDGRPRIVPMRVAADFAVESRDPDPRGMAVVGADRMIAGKVVDVWVDRSETIVRYLEVALDQPTTTGTVLLPINFCKIDKGWGRVRVHALLSGQFGGVPKLKNPDQVTLLEEDKIMGYYGGGTLYAEPSRAEPLL
jgi:photosynthetic reaction center H subunit